MFNNNQDILNELKQNRESHAQMVREFGRMGSALANIEKMMTKSLVTYTNENLVLQTYAQTFRAEGYLYNSIWVGDSAITDNAKLFIDGIVPQFSIPLTAGENAVNIPDGATFWVTTTSNNPVTSVLTRYNTPGNVDTNVSVIGNVPVKLADGSGSNITSANPTADGTTTGQALREMAYNFIFNGSTWDRLRTASADALAATGVLGSAGLLYNGASWDRARTASADALAATGLGAGGQMLYNGATWDRQRSATADALAATGVGAGAQMLYNGASWDRMRTNIQGNLLASAARTTAPTITNQTNYNAQGVQIIVNVTAASGTGGLTVLINGVSNTGAVYALNATPTAITATGIYVFEIAPSAGAASGAVVQRTAGKLPRTWNVTISVGDASSYTYYVDYALTN